MNYFIERDETETPKRLVWTPPKRPMLFDTLLPPGDRCRLKLGEDVWEMERGDGLPYEAVWEGDPDDRFLRVTFPDGRVLFASSICMTVEPGTYPARQQKKKAKKKPQKPQKPQWVQLDLF